MLETIFIFFGGTAFYASGMFVSAHHVIPSPTNNSNDVYMAEGAPSGLKLRCKQLKQGEPLYTLGYPKGHLKAAQGEYAGRHTRKNGHRSQIATFHVDSGASGSPVFDENYDVVGVVTHSQVNKVNGELLSKKTLFTSTCDFYKGKLPINTQTYAVEN